MRRKWRFWAWPGELRRIGLLGINRRNAEYTLAVNPRQFYPRVDDKLRTKRICESRGIPVPATYAAIQRLGDIAQLAELVRDRPDFVIKPARGSGGRGIVVVASHNGSEFTTPGGEIWTLADLRYHLSAILSGLYSLGGQPDAAIVEQRIIRHRAFENVSVGGTPDIRVIAYRCVPVMAMVRLPTWASRGKANLHQGAVAAAVDLRSGSTFGGVCRNRPIAAHPDTGAPIRGFTIPFWEPLLAAAMNLAEALELGYVGIDFVLDETHGPLILEANARPGLAIQVANRRGLASRLAFLDSQPPEMFAPGQRQDLIRRVAELA